MRTPRRLLTILCAALMAGCAAAGPVPPAAPGPAPIPDWLIGYMRAQAGWWEASNAAYRSADEPYDTFGQFWDWGAGGTSLAGTLYGRAGGGGNVEFWNFRIYWHPGTREARVDQWGHGGMLLTGTLRPDGEENGAAVFEIDQTWYGTSGRTARTRHRTLHRAGEQAGTSYDWQDGQWVKGREYLWRRVPGPGGG
jgi:hypothetical protein